MKGRIRWRGSGIKTGTKINISQRRRVVRTEKARSSNAGPLVFLRRPFQALRFSCAPAFDPVDGVRMSANAERLRKLALQQKAVAATSLLDEEATASRGALTVRHVVRRCIRPA